MIYLQKLMLHLACIRVLSSLSSNAFKLLEHPFPLFRESGISPQICRFYGVESPRHKNYLKGGDGETLTRNGRNGSKALRADWLDAQAALLDYLHSTRGLDFIDADVISRHSPRFLQKLLWMVVDGNGRSLARFLRYYPINEFEPFFESIGLEPSEYVPLLPRDFMYLSDDAPLLLENYHVLRSYDVPHERVGRIYKEAREVFGYGDGVLISKLRAFEEMGIDKVDVIWTVSSHPHLLNGSFHKHFGRVLEKLKCLGLEFGWVKETLPKIGPLDWRQILELLCLFDDLGCNKEQLHSLFSTQPGLLFDGSGTLMFSLISFLVKLGFTGNDICSLLLELPEIQLKEYIPNLKVAFHFLNEMKMEPADVERIFREHSAWLGLCCLKKPTTVLTHVLCCGKKRVRGMINKNPLVLKNWVLKTSRLRGEVEEMSRKQKIKFLIRVGLTEDSEEMKAALKHVKGKGDKLEERFECLVKAGLDPEDVARMVKLVPRFMRLSKQTIQAKIDCLVNELGYPISDLVTFPSFLCFKIERSRLRHSMYKWLCREGRAKPNLGLSTFIGCSEKTFVKTFVNSHPQGPQVWEELGKKVYWSTFFEEKDVLSE